ncbi:MAG: hypothetical protein JW876_03025 [Candidatus Krumholzibacteriota bacterium]|nr:hypothetical protein [Candidatus Krumholzibacteriota bacterium]
MKRRTLKTAAGLFLLIVALLAGCSEEFTGDPDENIPPEIWLSSGPVEGDTTGYQVHFYWSGWDPDGEIEFFEFVVAEVLPGGFNPEDTTGLDKWIRTTVHDSVIRVPANENPSPYNPTDPGDSIFVRYDLTHTFFIRAVDQQGNRSKPAHRSFTAWTIAPFATITAPVSNNPESPQNYSTVITFRWEGRDPIDSKSNSQDPDSIRYILSKKIKPDGTYDGTAANIVGLFNRYPAAYEKFYSPWISYRAPEDSGRSTIIGDDEILETKIYYFFAVQAKDEAGAVTPIFERGVNYREFRVSVPEGGGPLLTVTEQFLGSFLFKGDLANPVKKELPPGVQFKFKWEASAAEYGGEIVGYRYGWDVEDLSNPDDWESAISIYNREAPVRTYYSGTHTFYIEAWDNGNRRTLAQIVVEIIPFTMERNLFFVDDFNSDDNPKLLREMPTETEHDQFWFNYTSQVADFVPDRDIYDCQANNIKAPRIRDIAKYKNIIWVYSSSSDAFSTIVVFTPEGNVVQGGTTALNYLSLFLAKGGHLWTLGRSERAGGLASAFAATPLFPASFKFDHDYRNNEDTSGVNCMPYRDYCIRAVDKVMGSFQNDPDEMPPDFLRSLSRDAMRLAVKDPGDPLTAMYPGLPDSLTLWSYVTEPGMFFDPSKRGFYYAEVYDPQYYFDFKLINGSLPCYHAMYRMRAVNTQSLINDAAVAVWISKYNDVIPEVQSGLAVAANSFHFGIPLWFFNRNQVGRIVDVVFDEWQLPRAEPD